MVNLRIAKKSFKKTGHLYEKQIVLKKFKITAFLNKRSIYSFAKNW